jgi:hypothetical protein
MTKNLDYKILKCALSNDKRLQSSWGGVSTTILAQNLGINIDSLLDHIKFMERSELLITDGVKEETTIVGVTTEGRIFLERLENNRWQRRIVDWLIGGLTTVLFGLLLACLVYYFGWNK